MRMKTIENLDTGYQDIKINLNGTRSINVSKTKDNTDTIHTMPIKDELVGNYKQKINLIIDKFIHECKLNNYIVEKINGNQIFTIKRIDGKKLELRGLNIDTKYLEPIIYKYNLDYIDTLIQNLINNPNYRIVINMTKNQTNMGIEDNVLYLVLNENEKTLLYQVLDTIDKYVGLEAITRYSISTMKSTFILYENNKNEIVYNGSLKSNMEIGTYVRKRTLDRNLKTLQNILAYEQMKMEEE